MTRSRMLRAGSILLLLGLTGCLQMDTRVRLHEDGSATITERLQISRRLLDLDAQRKSADQRFEKFLSKAGSEKRMQKMGKGITLVSHKIQSGENGAREAVTVYKIPDLTDLRYMSPLLAYLNYGETNAIRFELGPVMSDPFGTRTGHISVRMLTMKPPQGVPRYAPDDPIPEGTPPSQLQIYRELGPIVRDMLKGFKAKLVFESYVPLAQVGFTYRGRSEQATFAELIDVDDKDLDSYGQKFMENEEIMLDLVRWEIGSRDVFQHTKNFSSNRTVPVLLIHEGSKPILFRPSKILFDRHLAGKVLDYGKKQGGKRKASFEQLRYKKVARKVIGGEQVEQPDAEEDKKVEKPKKKRKKGKK